MIPFAMPYSPEAAPILDLVGFGFRPAWQPADFIGPRMDCPMWLPAPDADAPYIKYDGVAPYAVATGLPTVLMDAPVADGSGLAPSSSLAGTGPSYVMPSAPTWIGDGSTYRHVHASEISNTTIIRKVVHKGDTIIVRWPSEWRPCECVAQPKPPAPPPIAPVPMDAGTASMLLAALLILAAPTLWRAAGRNGRA